MLALAESKVVTEESGRNCESYGADIKLPVTNSVGQPALLCEPQTSGGLIVSCTPELEAVVLARFNSGGFKDAATIGRKVVGSEVEGI